MLTVLSCITLEHNYTYLAIALLICTSGSVFSVRLFRRCMQESGTNKLLWLFWSSTLAASTIWSTHFVAMIAYDVPFVRSFDPALTAASFMTAFVTTTVGFTIAALSPRGRRMELGGAIFGLGIALMHYVGMAAYLVPGEIRWDNTLVLWSVALAALFGGFAMNRISRPCTRLCETASVAAVMLTILSMHFTGMSAVQILPSAGVIAQSHAVNDAMMLAAVLLVMVLLMLIVGAGYAMDLRSSQSLSAKYRHYARHDSLTGVPNRSYMEEWISAQLAGHGDTDHKAVLAILTLDQFKTVNDLHGYTAGDAVLKAFARNLSAALAPGEFLARFNGDEFVVFKDRIVDYADAGCFAHRLREVALKPIDWNEYRLSVRTSIGLAIFPDDSHDLESLIVRAALAAKRAKQVGGNQIKTYLPGMEEASRRQAGLAADLKRAISGGQLSIVYQPQNDTRSRELVGYEALLRWQHPEKGQISADDFIPIAERTGLILDIGAWALEQACESAVTWSSSLPVSVNASPLQMSRCDYPALVARVLEDTGLEPDRLEIELTESCTIEDHERVLAAIRGLRALGVKVSMDDFGTGYSSLNTLQNFPFDKIKVDRVFIQSIESDPRSRAIIRSAVLLGHSFKIPVLAEGVENEVQLRFLKEAGCALVQGFLFGKPVPDGQIKKLPDNAYLPGRRNSPAKLYDQPDQRTESRPIS